MKIEKAIITETSILIIMKSGVENLTVKNLAANLNVEQTELYKFFSKDEDILVNVFREFENELKNFVLQSRKQNKNPASELKFFFKNLYNLFLNKPYYLSIIFDKRLKKSDSRVNQSVKLMREMIENYLTELINAGKHLNMFKTTISTKILVNKILIEFKLLMKDEQLINEMIYELEILRKANSL